MLAWRRARWVSWPRAGVLLCFWGFLSEQSSVSASVPSDPRRGKAFVLSLLNLH